jgi:hypothetical protein
LADKNSSGIHIKKRKGTRGVSHDDPDYYWHPRSTFLYQLEKDVASLDEDELLIINKIFNDISDFYSLKENISTVIIEKDLDKRDIEDFFLNLISSSGNVKYTLGRGKDSSIKKSIWKYIFELPEILKGGLRIHAYT